MSNPTFQHSQSTKRVRLLLLCTLLAIHLAMLVAPAAAAPPADPYADAVDPSTTGLILNAGNAVGAPDGNSATIVGILGQSLTLDMGSAEEGTGNLTVYYGGLSTGVQVQVDFLDASHTVISSSTANLTDLSTGIHSTIVPYATTPTPYRYVRLTGVSSAYLIDAIEDTPTSGPDPYADAVDSASGLILNASNAIGAPDGATTTVVGILGQNLVLDMGQGEEGIGDLTVYYRAISSGVQVQVEFLDANHTVIVSGTANLVDLTPGVHSAVVTYNNAPTPYRYVRFTSVASAYLIDAIEAHSYFSDNDGDGLPDDWENQHGLDPNDSTGSNGASGDPDNDGLTNLEEYQHGTDPQDADTDNDGLPDGWEVDHNLDPKDATGNNGAAGNPDGDGLTNLEEYQHGTDPQVPNATTYSLSPSSGSTITLNTVRGQNVTTSITITNTGNSLLHVTSVSLTGSSAISRTSPSSFTVAAHSSAKINLLCNATNPGNFTASLSIASDAAAQPNTYAIKCNVLDAPVIASATPSAGTYGKSYTHHFVSSAQPATYNITAGALPPGITLSSSGTLSGTPTAVGAYSVTVRVTSTSGSSSQTYTIVVNKAPLMVKADNKTRPMKTNNPPLTFNYSGFVNGDTASGALSGAPVCTTTATATSPAGPYPITCSTGTLTAKNYVFTFVPGTLTIARQLLYLPILMTTNGSN